MVWAFSASKLAGFEVGIEGLVYAMLSSMFPFSS